MKKLLFILILLFTSFSYSQKKDMIVDGFQFIKWTDSYSAIVSKMLKEGFINKSKSDLFVEYYGGKVGKIKSHAWTIYVIDGSLNNLSISFGYTNSNKNGVLAFLNQTYGNGGSIVTNRVGTIQYWRKEFNAGNNKKCDITFLYLPGDMMYSLGFQISK